MNEEMPEPPSPHPRAEAYTVARVKSGLEYVDLALNAPTRKLSLVANDTPEKKQELKLIIVGNLQTFERDMQQMRFFRLLSNAQENQMQEELIKLRRLSFYARYGEYLLGYCKSLKKEDETRKIEDWSQYDGKYWIWIAKKLKSEAPDLKKLRDGILYFPKNSEELVVDSTHQAVQFASSYTCLDMKDNLAMIHHYAECKDFPRIDEYIKAGHFRNLAETLATDDSDIIAAISEEELLAQNLVASLIQTMVDEWFVRYPKEPDEPRLWVAKPELFARMERLKEIEEAKETMRKQVTVPWAARMIRMRHDSHN